MSDVADAGSNPAANESVQPDAGASPQVSAPVVADQGQADAAPSSAREALTKAFEKVSADPAAPKAPVAASGDRDPLTGQFKQKAAQAADPNKPAEQVDPLAQPQAPTADAPPARFTKLAQDEWAKASPVLRQEVKRLETELTQGLEKYRTAAEAFEPIRKYDDMARQYGTTVDAALANYVALDHTWAQDPLTAFFQTCDKTKTNPQALIQAAYNAMSGQPQQADPSAQIIRELHQKIATLEGSVGQINQTFHQTQEQQAYNAKLQEVNTFGAERPFFADLIPTMTRLVETGYATDLSAAYDNAVRLNPEISAKIEADKAAKAATTTTKPNGSNLKASLSITGSPSAGSNPSTSKPAGSPREALERAFNSLGA